MPTGLTVKQEAAIIALLHEPTLERAAKKAGVGERTLCRWLDEDVKFIAAYRKARRMAFTQAISMCQRFAPMAAGILAKVASDPASPAHVRVNAAAHVLKFGREGIELDDLVGRIDVLEQQIRSSDQLKGTWS